MAELYSITGLFYEETMNIQPWGGFLIRTIDEEENLQGMLVDFYGSSNIKGKMDNAMLKFRKQCPANPDQILNYNFAFKNGLWIGEYSSAKYYGKAFCKTSLLLQDVDFKNETNNLEEHLKMMVINAMNSLYFPVR